MTTDTVRYSFAGARGYLNTSSAGLPPARTASKLRSTLSAWEEGLADPLLFDSAVERSRAAFSTIGNIPVENVGILSQVATTSSMVAASLPDGAKVLCAEEDFTSLTYPFLVGNRLKVRSVPLDKILQEIDSSVDLIAVSAVQSSDGRILDLSQLEARATQFGVRTYLDVTQAAGWLPLNLNNFDVTSCGAYKWLCSPRGSGFLTVSDSADWLIPTMANWYATEEPWQNLYGLSFDLAPDARRFNVSPAWFDFVGSAESLEFINEIGVAKIHDHSVGLANEFREGMGMDPSNSAVVSLESDRSENLSSSGIKAAVRAGRVRCSFYLYNDSSDVALALEALQPSA